MAHFISPSRHELTLRRQQLRQRRRTRAIQAVWRLVLVSGLAVAIAWGALLPIWVIYQPQQIIIQGNQLLSPQTIYDLLPIQYPQRLVSIKPEAIAQTLKSEAPVGEVAVIRQLFPPALIIRIQERRPVAIAHQSGSAFVTGQPAGSSQVGLLDELGNWIPMQNVTELSQQIQLPELKVFGNVEQFHANWAVFYGEVSKSPVKISEIDWRDPANIILATELGVVHLGEFSPKLAQQLQVLDRMRRFPEKIDVSQLQYIDLRNPLSPSLMMVPTAPLPTVSPTPGSSPDASPSAIPLDDEFFEEPTWAEEPIPTEESEIPYESGEYNP